MSNTQKVPTEYDFQQTIRRAFNDEGATVTIDGFLAGKVGRKITQAFGTTTVPNDTVILNYIEDGVLLYQLTIVYMDSTQSVMISAERTA